MRNSLTAQAAIWLHDNVLMMLFEKGLEIFWSITILSKSEMIVEGINDGMFDGWNPSSAQNFKSGKLVISDGGRRLRVEGKSVIEDIANLGGSRAWLLEAKKPAARKRLEFNIFLLADFGDELVKHI